MPSPRRVRLLMMIVMAAVITTLLFTSRLRASTEQDTRTFQDFYSRTLNAMDHKRGSGGSQIVMGGTGGEKVVNEATDKDGDGSIDEDDVQMAKEMAERLRAAEQKAKDLANAKAPLKPDNPSDVVGVGNSAAGQEKKAKEKADELEDPETQEEHQVEQTLNEILKKSPVIIFSKTYCPYSKRAKGVLLDKYSIDPAPYVVELDEHPIGKKLQDKLGEMTGRRTVPNILINGKSIGGSDDIADLDTRGTLIDKIKSMGGQRVSMKERFVDKAKVNGE